MDARRSQFDLGRVDAYMTTYDNVWIKKSAHLIEKTTQLRTPYRKFLAKPLRQLSLT